MEFGIFLPARVDAHTLVGQAEASGFSHAWLYDSQMLFGDVYACLALCAERTRTIKLGPGVTNPVSRIAPLTASAVATINQLAPGRTVLGIGTGGTTVRAMGMPAARVDDMREYLQVCRALLRGEKTPYRQGRWQRYVQMVHQDGGFVNLRDYVPIYVSAFGPRMLELAGELADGVMFPSADGNALARAREHIRRGAEKAKRQTEEIKLLLYTRMYVTEPGEPIPSPRMVATLGPIILPTIARYALGMFPPGEPPPIYRGAVAAYRQIVGELTSGEDRYIEGHRGYLWEMQPEFAPLITEELLRASTTIGSPEACLQAIRAWEAAGIAQVGLQVAGDIPALIERFGREVIARF